MTESAFIQLHLNGDIDFNNSINVNYDVSDTTPFNGTITGITVSPTALSIDGEVIGTDMVAVLEEVTSVGFTFSFQGEQPITYNLVIESRSFFPNANGNSFFYFRVTPTEIPQTVSDQDVVELNQNQSIIFEPFIQDLTFGFSEFNPLIGNAENPRLSNDFQIADRSEGAFILPKNFDALLAGTATPAEVQESNYTATGWTNSRYEGSVSSKDNYGGVETALVGRTFPGSVYDDDTEQAAIYLASSRLTKNYFHTGGDKLPLFTSSSMGATIVSTMQVDQTELTFTSNPGLTGSLNVGELLVFGNQKEILKITNNDSFIDSGTNSIFVERGYFNEPAIINSGTEIFKVDDVKMYEFTEGTSNLSAIYKAQVYVEENKSISYTDEFGAMISQSFGETAAYILPD